MSQAVNILLEPSYVKPVWYLDSLNSLRESVAKKHYPVEMCSEPDQIVNPDTAGAVIVISTSFDWTGRTIQALRLRGIRPILVGTEPQYFGADVSGTIFNRRAGIERLVHDFSQAGRRRLALVGVNPASSNDLVKQEAFLASTADLGITAGPDDIFPIREDLTDAINGCLDKPGRYDGAICTNDYMAVALLTEAVRRGVKVPEDLFVAGFGNHLLGRCATPALTTATMDYKEMGVQALTIWDALRAHPKITAIIVTIEHQMIYRASTGHLAVSPDLYFARPASYPAAASVLGTVNRQIRSLEQCLRLCDELDYRIISELLAGRSYETIGFTLYLSRSSLGRRLKKIYQMVNVNNRQELADLIRRYIRDFDGFVRVLLPEQNGAGQDDNI